MSILDCYEAYRQEEQRQRAADVVIARLPQCDCCGHTIRPGEKRYRLNVRKDVVTVCEDCKMDLDDSEEIYEQEDEL